MKNDGCAARDRELANEELRFFGAITASVTHDLNNVISIIDQTSGLIRDMIVAEKSGAPLSVERLSDAIDATEKQSNRALEIIRRLNQFAHSADEPDVVFDVPEVIENLIDICRRFAVLKRAEFELYLPPARAQLKGNPFLFQDAVFRALRLALDSVQSGDKIRISLQGGDTVVTVLVEAPRGVDEKGNSMQSVAFVMREMAGRVELEPKGDGALLRLEFSKARDDGKGI